MNKDIEYLEALEKSRKKNVSKAIEDLLENVKEDGLSTITLTINFNSYNIGYKINKTYTRI
jgi:hypothetical protein